MPVKVEREVELGRIEHSRGFLIVRDITYDGPGRRFDVRQFFPGPDGALRPSGKGVAIRAEWIPQLRRALDAFEAAGAPSP